MAKQQAEAGAPAVADDEYPFSTLAIWRSKLQEDLGDINALGAGREPRYDLRLLLQQGKDVEQAVLGCLKDALFDLHEGVAWGLLDPAFEAQQRQLLLNAAANELNTDKQLCVQLARERGLLAEYARQLKRPEHHTLADYERVGELKFAMLVWRANLRRDASLCRSTDGQGGGPGEAGPDLLQLEPLFRNAYTEVLRLIRRCSEKSMRFWAARQAACSPTGASKQKLYDEALQRAQNLLLELAAAYSLDPALLHHLFEELPGPQAVPGVDSEAEAEAEAAADRRSGSRGGSQDSAVELWAAATGGDAGPL